MSENSAVVPELTVLRMDITEVIPYENNPRINDDAAVEVAKSIKSFGFNVPLVLDEQNVIITGHTRWKAAQLLGLDAVPVIIASHLTPEQVAAYRLADNRVAEHSKWDSDKLSIEMQILQTMGIDLTETGFAMEEITCLLESVSADCLDDLTVGAVCGDVEVVAATPTKSVFIGIGEFRIRMSYEDYNTWRKNKLVEFGSASALMAWVSDQLQLGVQVNVEEK